LLTHAPSEEEYLKILKNYDVLGIRSKSEINDTILKNNPHLLAIGAFCIGTNQISLTCANQMGIPAFNAPHSNTRSVAELVIAEMIALSRQLGDRNTLAHQGEWMKSADGAHEVRGKTLGIVGYGHIGSQVSVLAEALGMKVVFYDVIKKLPLGNAQPCVKLNDLLKISDFVSFHVPETPETKNMVSKPQLDLMKKGSFVINASRGTVIDIDALVVALKEKHIAGCAVDVFPVEPASNKDKFQSPLQGLKNVILTPHIGGSTEEAQYSIGLEVAESFCKFLQTGTTAGAVNFPNIDLVKKPNVTRIMNVHRNEPGVLGELNGFISDAHANIQAQYLSTDQKIGYLVVDLEIDQNKDEFKMMLDKIQSSKRSIKTRQVF
ncbi:MAG: phosphoglycerate dehydrogenase, partial [Bdellovibrio sp.]|nr:phosphoglycerate dehydrogenase [Bdellovibrio sp.]